MKYQNVIDNAKIAGTAPAAHMKVPHNKTCQYDTTANRDADIAAHNIMAADNAERSRQATLKAAVEAERRVHNTAGRGSRTLLRPVGDPMVDQFLHTKEAGKDTQRSFGDANGVDALDDSLQVVQFCATPPASSSVIDKVSSPATSRSNVGMFTRTLYPRKQAPTIAEGHASEMARTHLARLAQRLVEEGKINPIKPYKEQFHSLLCLRNAISEHCPRYNGEDPTVLGDWLQSWLKGQRKQARPGRYGMRKGVKILYDRKHQEELMTYSIEKETGNKKAPAVAIDTINMDDTDRSVGPESVVGAPSQPDAAVSGLQWGPNPLLTPAACRDIAVGDAVLLAPRNMQDDGSDQRTFDEMLADGVVSWSLRLCMYISKGMFTTRPYKLSRFAPRSLILTLCIRVTYANNHCVWQITKPT